MWREETESGRGGETMQKRVVLVSAAVAGLSLPLAVLGFALEIAKVQGQNNSTSVLKMAFSRMLADSTKRATAICRYILNTICPGSALRPLSGATDGERCVYRRNAHGGVRMWRRCSIALTGDGHHHRGQRQLQPLGCSTLLIIDRLVKTTTN